MVGRTLTRTRALVLMAAAITLALLALQSPLPAEAVSGSLSVSPAAQTVPTGNPITVTIRQNASGDTTAAQTDITFNQTLVQITDIALGAPYTGAQLIVGVGGQTKAQAIASANTTGTLENAAGYCAPGSCLVPSGNQDFLIVSMVGCIPGTSNITLSNYVMSDSAGNDVSPLTATNGAITISGTGGDADGDGDSDGCDNCPRWPNPAQGLPPWTVPASDPDCDGFTTAAETHVTTDANDQCGGNGSGSSEAWPPDLVETNSVNISDVLALRQVFGQTVPPASVRLDLVNSNSINISDVLSLRPLFGKTCSESGA